MAEIENFILKFDDVVLELITAGSKNMTEESIRCNFFTSDSNGVSKCGR